MNDEELMKILIDLEKKGWAKRTDWGGWEITGKAKSFIKKYGKANVDIWDNENKGEIE